MGRRLGPSPREWVRRAVSAFAAAGRADDASDEAIVEAMAAHPILMERPIAVRVRRAVVGRPPDDVLTLLDPEA